MRKTLVFFMAAAAACGSNPLASAPSTVPTLLEPLTAAPPLHHNIPASFEGHPEGPIYWLCATKQRVYIAPDGRVVTEEDHYLRTTECPAPID